LRVFMKDKRCPTCRRELEAIIFSKDRDKKFNDYSLSQFSQSQIDRTNGFFYNLSLNVYFLYFCF
jgi:hypothetical protein